jgi:hypothetical protein
MLAPSLFVSLPQWGRENFIKKRGCVPLKRPFNKYLEEKNQISE